MALAIWLYLHPTGTRRRCQGFIERIRVASGRQGEAP